MGEKCAGIFLGLILLSGCLGPGPDQTLNRYLQAQADKKYERLFEITSKKHAAQVLEHWRIRHPEDAAMEDGALFAKIQKTYPVNIKTFSVGERKEFTKRVVYTVTAQLQMSDGQTESTPLIYQVVREGMSWRVIPGR